MLACTGNSMPIDSLYDRQELPISLTGTLRIARGRRRVRSATASSSAGVHVRHRLALCITSRCFPTKICRNYDCTEHAEMSEHMTWQEFQPEQVRNTVCSMTTNAEAEITLDS